MLLSALVLPPLLLRWLLTLVGQVGGQSRPTGCGTVAPQPAGAMVGASGAVLPSVLLQSLLLLLRLLWLGLLWL